MLDRTSEKKKKGDQLEERQFCLTKKSHEDIENILTSGVSF